MMYPSCSGVAPKGGRRMTRGPRPQRKAASSTAQAVKAPESVPRQRRAPQLLFRMAVHEAGHAVARLYLDLGTIERITIEAPEGGSVTWRVDEVPDQTEELLTAVLVATLAGRAAEEEIIGSVAASSGGGPGYSDLGSATDIAFQMEASLGFARKWPLLHRGTEEPALLLALDADLRTSIYARLETAYAAARRVVARQRDAIEFLAAHLLTHRTLEGTMLDQMVGQVRERISP